jgi:hypothetical protein
MSRRLLAVLSLLPAFGGCTVTAVGERDDTRPSNVCTSDSECGGDNCREGICQTPNGMLEALFISATPPSDSGIPHMTFVAQLDDVPASGGSQDLTLPGPSHVVGSFVLPKEETCYPGFVSDDPKNPFLPADDGKALPVTVTLALSQRLLGFPQQLYFATTGVRNRQGGYKFELQVPRGEYDVYLVPPPHQLGGCPVPPQLYRSFPIDKENAEITFSLSSRSQLTLSIRWPKSSPSLTGWSVDIIEPLAGNPISTDVVLGDATDPGETSTTLEYLAGLSYSMVVTPAAAIATTEGKVASDLLRFRPRAGVIAPTIFMDRAGLGLLGAKNGVVAIDRFTQLPDPVQVESQLVRSDDGSPVAGYVTLVSTQIYGVDSGIFASYQTTIQVGADGALHAVLPPGTYKVQAVPPERGGSSAERALAALETTWDIPADVPVQYGKVLELSPIAAIVGLTPWLGAQVLAIPSPRTVLPFEEAFGEAPFTPRAGIGLVDEAGKFVVAADPGLFDVSVQAPESLGFGWYVRPGVRVGEHDQDLGRVTLPRPALLSGSARVSLAGTEAPLDSAAIRAYAYLDKDLAYTRDAKQAVSVVQVAETRADEQGVFRLLVPAGIAASK